MTARAVAVAMRAFRVAGLCCNWGSPKPQGKKGLGEASLPHGNIAQARSKVVFAPLNTGPHFCVADNLSTVPPLYQPDQVGRRHVLAQMGPAVFADETLFHQQVDVSSKHLSTDVQLLRQLGLPDEGMVDNEPNDFHHPPAPQQGESNLLPRIDLRRIQPRQPFFSDRPDLLGPLEHEDVILGGPAVCLKVLPDLGKTNAWQPPDQGKEFFTQWMRFHWPRRGAPRNGDENAKVARAGERTHAWPKWVSGS